MNIMSVNPMATSTPPASGSGTTGTNSASSGSDLKPNDFITLLVAQLKSQDPFNPMDPTTFVSQLVQFNTLQQVIGIHQDLTPSSTTGTGSAAAGTANAAAMPTTSK